MKTIEFYHALEARLERSLSCAWDRDGVMVLRSPGKEVKKVLCCLDVTARAAEHAISCGFDVILSHHALIFTPLASLRSDDPIAARAASLYENDVAVFSFHTRLDAADGGVNDVLSDLFSLRSRESFLVDGQPMGRVGALSRPVSGKTLAKKAKELLSCPAIRVNLPDKKISKLAVIGGSGGGSYKEAIAAGADALLTGEASHHVMLDAADAGLCILTAGHDYTERPVAFRLAELCRAIDPEIRAECFADIPLPTV